MRPIDIPEYVDEIDEQFLRKHGIVPLSAAIAGNKEDITRTLSTALSELSLLNSKNFWLQAELEKLINAFSDL